MARLTHDKKESLMADYHTGEYSKNELAKKYNTSHTTVNKITKDIEPKHKEKVSTLVAVKRALANESFKESHAVETLVELKLRREGIIYGNAEKLAYKINKMTDEVSEPQELRHLVEANDKLAITMKVADRHAPKVEVTNTQQNNEQKNILVEFR